MTKVSNQQPDPTAEDWQSLFDDAMETEATLDHDLAIADYRAIRVGAGNQAIGRRARLHEVRLWLKLGRNDDAVVAADALLEDCTTADVASELAEALSERAHVGYRSGDGEALSVYARKAVEVAKTTDSIDVLAHALRYLGIAHEFAGRHAEAETTYLELLELAPEGPHLSGVCNSLGEIARAAGRFGTAARWYKRFHEEWRRQHGDTPNIVYLNNMGAALVEVGQMDEGRTLLTRGIEEQRRSGHLAMLSETYYYRALASLKGGRLGETAQDVVEGYLLATELGEGEMMGLLLRLLAQVRQADTDKVAAAEVGGTATPEDLLNQSIAILDEAGKPAEAARSRWVLGRLLAGRGPAGQASGRAVLAEARTVYTHLGMRHWADLVAVDELALEMRQESNDGE
ncbi:MAG: tetratricopeptide (TPR) repeat protein [Myxococcota bacterium]|jgi:tetratricopeptide (TPR) repeat protein